MNGDPYNKNIETMHACVTGICRESMWRCYPWSGAFIYWWDM